MAARQSFICMRTCWVGGPCGGPPARACGVSARAANLARLPQLTTMPEVIIHDDESFERALKRFKKKCEKAGILSDLRKHRHYEKPSERRKRKMNAARRKGRRTRVG